MKAIVVGSGGREHALAWTLLQSSNVEGVICIPAMEVLPRWKIAKTCL